MDTTHNDELLTALQEADPAAAPEAADLLATALQSQLEAAASDAEPDDEVAS